MTISLVQKRVILAIAILIVIFSIWLKLNKMTTIQLVGAVSGLGWMLYNIFGFMFDRDMSMRGKIPFSVDSEVAVRRKFVFGGTVIIYILLIVGIFQI